MQIFVTDPDGKEHALEAIEGWRVMEIIRDYGLPIKAECGGACACATCHVYVEGPAAATLPPVGADENDLLDSSDHRQEGSRLACQLTISDALDGLRVVIAPAD